MSYGLPNDPPRDPHGPAYGQSAGAPVCPRHGDRPSYVRCQRCGRPACAECQRPAPVGVQCVDCVREANRSAPVARTAFGARPTDGRPLVTYTMIALCVVTFLAQWAVPTLSNSLLWAGVYILSEPWRMITSTFLHSQGFLMHIAFNMYALWIIGRVLEPMLGRLRFALLYLLSGVGGSVAVLLLDHPLQGVVGASGAIFGLFGALLIVTRARGGNFVPILIIVGINLVIGFIPGFNVSWQAHLGGLLTGAAVAAVVTLSVRRRPSADPELSPVAAAAVRHRRRNTVQIAGFVAIALILVALTWWGASTVPERIYAL
ncbi:rhomboid family intramembrane serine protease [Zhihengliuella sp.]|uniref:rhomboid family intramembrane serine protease n=1 Tax=Zhihengliuella sp. TaxID=1954483 RepID=UPI002811C469|nr:rhomboid family intramembrane serine protease [Zhihengliuella sp.]